MNKYDGVYWHPEGEYVPDVFAKYIRDTNIFERNDKNEFMFWPFCEVLWKLSLVTWDQYL
jgi:hypothetical protein